MRSDIRSSMNPTVGPEYIYIIVKTRGIREGGMEKGKVEEVGNVERKGKVRGEEEGKDREGKLEGTLNNFFIKTKHAYYSTSFYNNSI